MHYISYTHVLHQPSFSEANLSGGAINKKGTPKTQEIAGNERRGYSLFIKTF